MGFFTTGFEKSAALCLGLTGLAAGALTPGLSETITSGAALTGAVIDYLGPSKGEHLRIERAILARLRREYGGLILAEGGRLAEADLWAADDALSKAIDGLRLKAKDLADAAMEDADFVTVMTDRMMGKIALNHPEHFGVSAPPLQREYARRVFTAGFEATARHPDFYKRIGDRLIYRSARMIDRIERRQEHLLSVVEAFRVGLSKAQADISALETKPDDQVEEGSDRAFSRSITEELATFGLKVERLTADQFRVIDHLRHHRRVRIMGSAGSGKTLVACEKASRLSRAGLSTLIVCHNPLLADHIRSLLGDSSVAVLHFAALIDRLVQASDEAPREVDWDIHDEPVDAQLTLAFDSIDRDRFGFDAIIVDEGQDFRPEWWLVIEALLRRGEESHLYIFHDDDQALLVGRGDYPVSSPPIEITRNCRNASSVLSAMGRFCPTRLTTEEALQGTGFVDVFRSGGEVLQYPLRSALRLGLTPDNLMMIVVGRQPPKAWIGKEIVVPKIDVSGWQASVRDVVAQAVRQQHDDYEYSAGDARSAEWVDWFNLRDEVLGALAGLSAAPWPGAADIALVRRAIRDHAYFSPHAERFLEANPETSRLEWQAGADGPRLRVSHARQMRALQVAAFLRSEHWAADLCDHWMVKLIGSGRRVGPNDVPLLSVGASKGLEADVAVLLVEPHIPVRQAEKYIAASRARFGLIVWDAGDQFRLTGSDAPG